MSRPLGVLRPEPGNGATARGIEALGHRALRLPLFVVRPVAWACPDPVEYDGLMLTSANALRHGGADLAALTALPVHAVGEATAAAARRAGFTVVAVGTGGADAMRPQGRILRLAGRDHFDVPGAETIIVYASEALQPDLSGLSDGVALLHSARAARVLADRITDPATVAIAAISPAVADAAGPGWRAVTVAEIPTDAALIAAAISLAD